MLVNHLTTTDTRPELLPNTTSATLDCLLGLDQVRYCCCYILVARGTNKIANQSSLSIICIASLLQLVTRDTTSLASSRDCFSVRDRRVIGVCKPVSE